MTQEVINQQIELTSQLESLTKIEQCIDELREQYVISEDEYGNILIAITEAVNNAITHGNGLNPDKKVCLKVGGSSEEVCFVIEDEGIGFDYNNVPDPTLPENIEKLNGRGIFLMKTLADEVTFEKNGSKILLKFTISVN